MFCGQTLFLFCGHSLIKVQTKNNQDVNHILQKHVFFTLSEETAHLLYIFIHSEKKILLYRTSLKPASLDLGPNAASWISIYELLQKPSEFFAWHTSDEKKKQS